MHRGYSIFLIIVLIPIFFLGFASCNKQNGAATPAEDIEGTWKKVAYAFDGGNSGVISPIEIMPQPTTLVQRITFNSNGSGVENDTYYGVAQPTLNFVWTVSNKDSLWMGYENHDTLTYYLKSVSSSNLILTIYAPIGGASNAKVLQWYQYNK